MDPHLEPVVRGGDELGEVQGRVLFHVGDLALYAPSTFPIESDVQETVVCTEGRVVFVRPFVHRPVSLRHPGRQRSCYSCRRALGARHGSRLSGCDKP